MAALASVAMLVAITGCGSSQSPSSAPPAGVPAASCGLADALHEHQLHDDATLRATVGTSLVGRLETGDGIPHAKDSGNAGSDAIAYRIEQATTLRLGVAAGSIARVRLLDPAGVTVAEARSGSAAIEANVTPGEYTLVLDGDDSRELHYLVQPESCRRIAGTASAIGRATSFPPDVQTPGVYVQELDPTTSSIVPAATWVTAFVGALGAGPVGQPVELFAATDLTAQFGAAAADSPVGRAVAQFFANGGSDAWVVGTSDATPDALLGSGSGGGGITALRTVQGWSILVLPDVAMLSPDDATTVLASAVPFAASASAFTIIDVPLALGDVSAATGWTNDSLLSALTEAGRPYAAVYFGPLQIEDTSGAKVTMGASGAIAGLYAATDAQSRVWAQPTGAIVPAPGTTLTLPVVVDDADTATLADALVNVLRSTPDAEVWGARTLAGSTDPRAYVGSSRTDLMLRTSIVESLQWVVFEPDDQTLWSTVTNSLTAFLTSIWHDGGLYGATAADAFDVVCDISNNPPQLIEVGQLAVDVTLTLAPPDATLLQHYTFLVEGP